ncbi:hypothetical protein Bca52824_014539 [Brassica carinata]|uniref:MADS-box domain-containing protein n=1 Tax=Brassica carinata TaxID=52824 RepID=A0A8X7W1K3_BRACI|nr:hypothetical protein Bca52824_014539 [Brassica carinata]
MTSKKKESSGRQRIRMAKIEKESHRQVAFSKRRAGLFKKASELCTLCGVEVAIIVFSPAKKPFSFGHPNVYSVLDRYRNNTSFQQESQPMENTATRSELNLVLSQVEEEKMKREEMRKASEIARWSVEEMSLLQLQEMRSALEELRNTMVVTPTSYMNTTSTGFSCIYNSSYVHASS